MLSTTKIDRRSFETGLPLKRKPHIPKANLTSVLQQQPDCGLTLAVSGSFWERIGRVCGHDSLVR